MKELTIREKAAVALYLHEGKNVGTTDLYIVASNKSVEEVRSLKALSSSAAHWFARPQVQAYVRALMLKDEDRRAQERALVLSEMNFRGNTTSQMAGGIDYSDPKNRQRLYNNIIAQSKDDPRTQLDAAKMFEQSQKDDREAAKVQKQSRVYLPLRCESCALYLKAKEELNTSK